MQKLHTTADTVLNNDLQSPVAEKQPVTPVKSTAKHRSGHNGGRKPVKFDLAEAIRLRALGWSYRRISWKLNVSKQTVMARLAAVQVPEFLMTVRSARTMKMS